MYFEAIFMKKAKNLVFFSTLRRRSSETNQYFSIFSSHRIDRFKIINFFYHQKGYQASDQRYMDLRKIFVIPALLEHSLSGSQALLALKCAFLNSFSIFYEEMNFFQRISQKSEQLQQLFHSNELQFKIYIKLS